MVSDTPTACWLIERIGRFANLTSCIGHYTCRCDQKSQHYFLLDDAACFGLERRKQETGYRVERSLTGVRRKLDHPNHSRSERSNYTEQRINSFDAILLSHRVTIDAQGNSATSNVAECVYETNRPYGGFYDESVIEPDGDKRREPSLYATGYNVERSLDNANWSTVSTNQAGLTYTDNQRRSARNNTTASQQSGLATQAIRLQ